MRIVTFYSFKGGVGRTMALMNVAWDLVQRGRRVLVVDFDLEAPGISTFDFPRPRKKSKGLVEFVHDYLASHKSPNVEDYTYKSKSVKKSGGELWIMPAGLDDASYGNRLADIDWQELYEKHEGYFLFEDLKSQWNEVIKPDYVFVDSRTGHTDIGGICTRQLPNAVVVLFFPNKQNLLGLKYVVETIRDEKSGRQKKDIHIYFVTSNVPDLDDEKEILAKAFKDFKKELGYDDLTVKIHHYDSLAILNQTVFTKERPQSRLASEYRELADKIQIDNPEDRDGAIQYVKSVLAKKDIRQLLFSETTDTNKRLREIDNYHDTDPEILLLLAECRSPQHGHDEERELLLRAIDHGTEDPVAYIRLARLEQLASVKKQISEKKKILEKKGRLSLIKQGLNCSSAGGINLWGAIRIILEEDWPLPAWLLNTCATRNLEGSEASRVVALLRQNEPSLQFARQLIESRLKDSNRPRRYTQSAINQFNGELGMVFLGLRQPGRARKVYDSIKNVDSKMTQRDSFNYGMAIWGETGTPPIELFKEALKQAESADMAMLKGWSANYNQSLAVAYWICGNVKEAEKLLQNSKELVKEIGRSEDSCWRYQDVEPKKFLEDLKSIEIFFKKDKGKPVFFPGEKKKVAEGIRVRDRAPRLRDVTRSPRKNVN